MQHGWSAWATFGTMARNRALIRSWSSRLRGMRASNRAPPRPPGLCRARPLQVLLTGGKLQCHAHHVALDDPDGCSSPVAADVHPLHEADEVLVLVAVLLARVAHRTVPGNVVQCVALGDDPPGALWMELAQLYQGLQCHGAVLLCLRLLLKAQEAALAAVDAVERGQLLQER